MSTAQEQKVKEGKEGTETFVDMDKSVLCRLDVRAVRLLCSTEQGLLLCSVIFLTSIPSSP